MMRGWNMASDSDLPHVAVMASTDGLEMGVVQTWRDGESPRPNVVPGIDGRSALNDYEAVWFVHRQGTDLKDLDLIVLNVLDDEGWQEFAGTYAGKFPQFFPRGVEAKPDDKDFEQEKKMFENFKWGMAYMCPRGVGPWSWDVKEKPADPKLAAAVEKDHVQRLRRFYLIGQTLEGQQVFDVRSAIRALRAVDGLQKNKLWLQASRVQAGNALYASLFEDGITRVDLHELPHSHMQGPVYLNVLKNV